MDATDARIQMWSPAIREALLSIESPAYYEIIVEAMYELGGALVEAIGIIEGAEPPSEHDLPGEAKLMLLDDARD
jgi:hypothetical protein